MTDRCSDDDLDNRAGCDEDDGPDHAVRKPVALDRWPAGVLLAVWALIWAATVSGLDQEPVASAFAAFVVTLVVGLPVVMLAGCVVGAVEAVVDLYRSFTAPAAPSREPTQSSR